MVTITLSTFLPDAVGIPRTPRLVFFFMPRGLSHGLVGELSSERAAAESYQFWRRPSGLNGWLVRPRTSKMDAIIFY